jgi:hypothetical protein
MEEPKVSQVSPETPNDARALVRRHLRIGWIGLLCFATLGLVLEALHAFKSPAYLGVGSETRRLMWTLAHAHGIGLSLLQVVFAATVHLAHDALTKRLELAGRLLFWALLLLPAGFFLGGIATFDGDPGIGVMLAPFGALCVWVGVLLVTLSIAER